VGLIRQYSNRVELLNEITRTLQRVRDERRTDSSEQDAEGLLRAVRPPRVWRVRDRLSPEDIAQLVKDYRAGASLRQVANQYGISRPSVVNLLRQHKARRKDCSGEAA
jgi:hypothetical protein